MKKPDITGRIKRHLFNGCDLEKITARRFAEEQQMTDRQNLIEKMRALPEDGTPEFLVEMRVTDSRP